MHPWPCTSKTYQLKIGLYNNLEKTLAGNAGALAVPGPKRPKPTKKNPEKYLENPPKMPTSQRRHMSNNGGLYSRATARTTPSNSPP